MLISKRNLTPLKSQEIDEYISQARDRSYETMMRVGKRGLNLAANAAVTAAAKVTPYVFILIAACSILLGNFGVSLHCIHFLTVNQLHAIRAISSCQRKDSHFIFYPDCVTDAPLSCLCIQFFIKGSFNVPLKTHSDIVHVDNCNLELCFKGPGGFV